MKIRLTHIDGKLPNMALMRLAAYWRARGAEIHFTKDVDRGLLEPDYDHVYGSAIFSYSAARVERFKSQFPTAIVGGTHDMATLLTLEQILPDIGPELDYSIYPGYEASIGFTQRGCRLKCGFCVVPRKEGKNHPAASVLDIWRGEGNPKHIVLLDNDFFGGANWKAEAAALAGFRVNFNQGINVRLINEEAAATLATLDYADVTFKHRRLYTAWDNIGDETRFFRGIDMLQAAGITPRHIMVYMLVGYDKRETWGRLFYRLNKIVERGLLPYPMVFNNDRLRGLPRGDCNLRVVDDRNLRDFQRYVVRRVYTWASFDEYEPGLQRQPDKNQIDLFPVAA